MVSTAPYGSWKSPITPALIAKAMISFEGIWIDGRDIYWAEGRPQEGGRNTLVLANEGRGRDVLPEPYNARTRVHEYGGGSFIAVDGAIYFSNFADQRVYSLRPEEKPRPLTPQGPIRFADFAWDGKRGRLICILEDHGSGGKEPVNSLASIDTVKGEVKVLSSGHDFYSSPRINPDGSKVAWISWDHPNMPWDSTRLWVADILKNGCLGEPLEIAGGPEHSVLQPQWSPGGVLHFVSEATGWWNIWRNIEEENEQVIDMDAEFAPPHWTFGTTTYGFISEKRILCAFSQNGSWKMGELDTDFGELEERTFPFSDIRSLRVGGGQAVLVAGSPSVPLSLIRLDIGTGVMDVMRRSSDTHIDSGYLSMPDPLTFPSAGGREAHAFLYAPCNQDYEALEDELPPLLVVSHGGPTSSARTALNLLVQYWTSRGFAVLDVNYGGSTGYGREYRERLRGNWGVVDVEDCSHGARFVAQEGRADGSRMAIRGGSAGGYTTLSALAFSDTFRAGASYFGVTDPEMLAKETHKFESRYLDGLIAPYPEQGEIYQRRSPLHHADGISVPVIFFQGLDDPVVPPDQAESMVNALRRNRIPVSYIAFEGEQHGFRRAENIIRSMKAELYFYSRVFGFVPGDELEPVEIENL